MALQLKSNLTQLLDLLKTDVKTKDILWHYGRIHPDDIQDFDRGAGALTYGPLSDVPISAPTGREGVAEILIGLYVKSNQGIEAAEKQLQDALDNVLDVLAANRGLNSQNNRVVLSKVPRIDMDSNPAKEAQLAWCTLHVAATLRA